MPTRYVIYNRQKLPRIIENYEELYKLVQDKYPNYTWERGIDPSGLKNQAIYYATVKFIFAISGSGVTNMIFMHHETVFCEVYMKDSNLCMLYLSAILRIHHPFVFLPGYVHHEPKNIYVEPAIFLSLIKKGLKHV